jgi:predicted RNA-binding Zn-ribbon protein involved in translation (DUF1610 family)
MAFDYVYTIVVVIILIALIARKLLLKLVLNVIGNVVQKRRINRLKRIQETMQSYVCPLCGRSDVYGGVIKNNSMTLECHNCHHIWTVPITDKKRAHSYR